MKKSVNEILQEMNVNGLHDKASGRLRLDELCQLYEISDDYMELICACYDYGYFKGLKAGRKKKQQRTNIRENSCEG